MRALAVAAVDGDGDMASIGRLVTRSATNQAAAALRRTASR